jgi:DNA-binding transcriptional LysR family regulator
LVSHDCVIWGNEPSATWILARDGEAASELRVAGRVASNDYGFVRQATVHGLGIGLLPSVIVPGDVAARRLIPILPEYRIEDVALYAVYPSARHLPVKARVFIDFVADRLERMLEAPAASADG